MTQLSKQISRISNTSSRSGRLLVISLMPGATDLITIREKGRRKGYSVPLEQVYLLGARIYADAARKEKAHRRKERKNAKA